MSICLNTLSNKEFRIRSSVLNMSLENWDKLGKNDYNGTIVNFF
jgi:hypothetical protein